ncbi:MAG: histidinol dehydrogenase, partial [Alphaproteobacteria bacterium]|nr:histidinol dehydrogenase [Alphaproteobacteria bacterium]
HVLPTSRTARFSSGLGTSDFMKRTTLIGADEKGLAKLVGAGATLADAEGLASHARSLRIRTRAKRR